MSQQAPEKPRGRCVFPEREPVRVWTTLQHGDYVEVWSTDSFRYLAYVDDLADDGTLIWVVEDGMGSRHLLVRGDPVTLYSI
ncbi:hypothetical protein [Arthrobacter dokdonensis]|uniref:hypothetical protein n=1 Tax=Arthrobacter dokdonellae TaxID=2211210 RepID=UPI001013D1E9|nr:hypothetical protein [Arthrobacter dokdonellae]